MTGKRECEMERKTMIERQSAKQKAEGVTELNRKPEKNEEKKLGRGE